MRMNVVLILFLSINGINCMKNGIPAESLSSHQNFIATIWQHTFTTPRYLCSGSIISQRHIITAGHCVHDVRNYEIYVSAGRIDLNDELSVMVHNIYLHHNFEKVYNPDNPLAEYWLNDIAVLDLVYKLTLGPHIAWISFEIFRRSAYSALNNCYIMGWNYNLTDTRTSLTTLQWADVLILGNSCAQAESLLMPNEMYAVITTGIATLDDTDIGTSLMYDKKSLGIIVGRSDRTGSVVTVLTLAPYKHFIKYIEDGGIAQIERGDFGDAVSLWESGNFRCGGFIVHDHYIVTAAHCVKGVKVTNLVVVFEHFETPGIVPRTESALVERIEIHPLYSVNYNENFREHRIENDIAVLKLNSDLLWNPLVRLKELPDISQITGDKPCEILRWTHPPAENTVSRMLVKSFVTILNDEENEELGFHLGAEKFRARGFYKLPFATNKDIGNPIIFENNIIGMVVAVDHIAPGSTDPVTCLKILPYEDFIRKIINRT